MIGQRSNSLDESEMNRNNEPEVQEITITSQPTE